VNGALLEAAYLRIRALHKPAQLDPHEWPRCVEDDAPWPCATYRALQEAEDSDD